MPTLLRASTLLQVFAAAAAALHASAELPLQAFLHSINSPRLKIHPLQT
jgi:hypothetical protein